jgi:cytochrome c peroxidase
MKQKMYFVLALSVAVMFLGSPAYSGSALNPKMQSLLDSYKKASGEKSFSAEEGKKLYYIKRMHSEKKEEISCTSCHMDDPSKEGKTPVGKPIEPLSPAVNKERFTDPEKVEKWFKRNCTGVFERECTPKEKGDFITYMFSL